MGIFLISPNIFLFSTMIIITLCMFVPLCYENNILFTTNAYFTIFSYFYIKFFFHFSLPLIFRILIKYTLWIDRRRKLWITKKKPRTWTRKEKLLQGQRHRFFYFYIFQCILFCLCFYIFSAVISVQRALFSLSLCCYTERRTIKITSQNELVTLLAVMIHSCIIRPLFLLLL